ncbi:MAG: crossover junction endodeoxyribonuclease RuvC [Spirochaetaceae bacterium]|jgi:crossover junction endodeoxyribonuclease RuvC|nr:crossover junction endodeoxyribonuclease RuvC [Spirochaetaceae bacterium]
MIVLGIDPGLANTGWGVVESQGNRMRCLGMGTIKTKAKEPMAQRLNDIYSEIILKLDEYKPAVMAVETLFFSKNSSSAMAVAHARGVALLASQRRNVLLKEYNPNEIKQAVVGMGRADKKQVESMVKLLLGSSVSKGSDHAMDALASAICCINNGVKVV